ncbi:MAG: hypothetical protein IT168_21555 [Bryobacterales bacterium]|nr:hypothetical protein [Bryobacterales bacterium]
MIQIITALLLQSQTMVYDEQRFLVDAYFRQLQYQKENGKLIAQKQKEQEAEIRDYFFRERFNKFVIALREFAQGYQDGKVNLKKAQAVRKAWHKLEQTDGWFHEDAKKDPKLAKATTLNADSEPTVKTLATNGAACQAQP